MPKLVTDSALLAGFDPGSILLPMPVMGSVWSQAPVGDFGKQLWIMDDYASFTNLTQHALAQVGFSTGVPDWATGAFKTFFELAPQSPNGAQLAKGVVAGTASLVQQALQETATSVPIVGIIVQLGIFLWNVIENALKHTDAADTAPDKAIVYELANDLEAANQLKNYTAQLDWTQLFLPPATDGWTLSEITWVPGGGKRQGFKFAIPSYSVEYYGLLPGISERLGTYQFPEKDIGSSRPWNFYTGYGMSTTGQVLPSTRKFSTVLWQTAMKPSVAMFQVDSQAVSDGWDGYFDSLWEFSNLDFGKKYKSETARTIAWAIRRACTYCRIDATNSGPRITRDSEISAFPTSKLENGLNAPLTYRYNDIVRYVGKVHRLRARHALDTIICAYVPPDAPLLLAEPTLAALHAERRKQLLEDPARYDVEPDMIPDAAYRAAMDEAQTLNVHPGPQGIATIGPFGPQRTAPPIPASPAQGLPQGVTPTNVGRVITNLAAEVGVVAAGSVVAGGIAWAFRDELSEMLGGRRRR